MASEPVPASVWVRRVGALLLAVGLLVYSYAVYYVLEAGGLSTSSELGTCAQAATGTFRTSYRVNEQLTLTHGFFPPTATCRWSGGTSAVLVGAGWTWTGPLLTLAALGLLAGSAVARKRRPHPLRP